MAKRKKKFELSLQAAHIKKEYVPLIIYTAGAVISVAIICECIVRCWHG